MLSRFRVFLIFLLSLALASFMKSGNPNARKIMGHWATNDFMGEYEEGDTLGTGDTVNLEKIKFSEKFYHWGGGYLSGIEFKADSQFTQYRNVLCSDETDTKVGFEEKYYFISDSVVEVKSVLRKFRFKILRADSKKLSILIIKPRNW